MRMEDLDLDIELLMSLVEAKPVFGTRRIVFIKTESKRKSMDGGLCLYPRRLKLYGMLKKNAFGEYCHNLLNTANSNPYKLIFFFTYPIVHIFDICYGTAPASVRKFSATLFLTLFTVNSPTY